MQVISTFEQYIYIEIVISSLLKLGIARENILVIPLSNRKEEMHLFDTLHRADGISLFDKGAAIGTALSVVGVSIGFELKWGPVYWGLIGAVTGFIIGFLIDVILYKFIRNRKSGRKGEVSEIVLVVDCPNELIEKVIDTLWEHFALGVAKIEG